MQRFSWRNIGLVVTELSSSPLIPLIRKSLEEAFVQRSEEYELTLDVHEISRPIDKVNLTQLLMECSKESRSMILIFDSFMCE